jgi:hypothetical protein
MIPSSSMEKPGLLSPHLIGEDLSQEPLARPDRSFALPMRSIE